MVEVHKLDAACGAEIRNADLSSALSSADLRIIRTAWMEHHVLVFPEQKLENDDLVRFAEYLGPIGDDPFIKPIEEHDRIAAIHRKADETGRIFADNWHSDWSFMSTPPAGTFLYGIVIPPTGGDTYFSNQHLAYESMQSDMKEKYEELLSIHSARTAYSRDGVYAKKNYDGTMNISVSDEANEIQHHPLVRTHPESGKQGIFGGSYVVDFEGVEETRAKKIIEELVAWQDREEFVYRHKWKPNMLVLWDNRSVLHRASGGYEGYERRLHRLTIADSADYY
ncbi:TauD/TfdA family dioxygenase [Sneathiella marina]|uniref:TauD/TfdA family dioxygenase n=1 Tax=Sneathiella marina TaxID=2950108 RepID=A0ABY4W2B2_9PROT|nr:TauD/TfdA family dioxygenase [Sneathiella marina]USG61074.1 TauD/TfdA family dioxygenase [Sneathiella marina]